jgi:predicted RNase H-like HicB family nuclease
MRNLSIIVRAVWDDEANVWVASSSDIDGLATEASTLEELHTNVLVMVEELLALNGGSFAGSEIPVHIMAEHMSRVRNPAFH